jgi:hypothetical protein
MKKREEEKEIDNLINEFFASLEFGDENEVLKEYITRYPEHAQVFFEAASYEKMVKEMPKQEYGKEQEDTLNLRAQSVVQNLLYKFRQDNSAIGQESEKAEDIAPIVNLFDEIKRKGFTVKSFAKKARLPETVIEAFNTREVRFGSITRQAIKNVALSLGRSAQDVGNYLSQAANPQPMHARADESPRFSSQMEFLELIATDPDIEDDDKQYWLAQKPQEVERFI